MRPWLQTYTGRVFDLQRPTIEMIDARDIAHSLANTNRYNGHTKFPYSVAQHSVLMAELLSSEGVLRRQALMHDAHDAYTGDIITPIKREVPELVPWEIGVRGVVRRAFGLPALLDAAIDLADTRMLCTERAQLQTWPPPKPWAVDGSPYPDLRIVPWDPERSEREMYRRMDSWGLIDALITRQGLRSGY